MLTKEIVSMNYSTNPFVDALDKVVVRVIHYRKQVLLSLAVVGLGGALFVGYTYYQNQRDMQASKALQAAVNVFRAQASSAGDEAQWQAVAKTFEAGYSEHKGATIAASFLAYQADALLNAGKAEEAVEVLRLAVKKMSVKAVCQAYQLKLALVLLDSSREELQKEGLEQLQAIAQADKNVMHEQALYYLGMFYWVRQNFEEAKNYWQQYMIKYGADKGNVQFAEKVREKLELLTV